MFCTDLATLDEACRSNSKQLTSVCPVNIVCEQILNVFADEFRIASLAHLPLQVANVLITTSDILFYAEF